jgi:hypothetical protein
MSERPLVKEDVTEETDLLMAEVPASALVFIAEANDFIRLLFSLSESLLFPGGFGGTGPGGLELSSGIFKTFYFLLFRFLLLCIVLTGIYKFLVPTVTYFLIHLGYIHALASA